MYVHHYRWKQVQLTGWVIIFLTLDAMIAGLCLPADPAVYMVRHCLHSISQG